MDALVIGGTGPTGPFIVNGLRSRGYRVAILHRGTHDTPEIPPEVERIKGDPHFRETLAEALGTRTFDLVVATYGRIRYVAEVLEGHTARLLTVGGGPGFKGAWRPETMFPRGLQVPLPEDAPKVESAEEFRFGYLSRMSEDAVMERHEAGHYVATHLRYPLIYGPRQVLPLEWWVMRRVLDGRRHMVLPDSGLTLLTRGYSENMAHAVLLAVDHPEVAGGRIYNCGDVHQLTLAQWVETITHCLDAELEILSVPTPLAYPAHDLMLRRRFPLHQIFDLHRIRAELGYEDLVPPLEALARTVAWYREHPPAQTEEMRADLAAHYRTEDEMAGIVRDAHARLAAVEHVARDFSHPYAHPKAPGLDKDHMNR